MPWDCCYTRVQCLLRNMLIHSTLNFDKQLLANLLSRYQVSSDAHLRKVKARHPQNIRFAALFYSGWKDFISPKQSLSHMFFHACVFTNARLPPSSILLTCESANSNTCSSVQLLPNLVSLSKSCNLQKDFFPNEHTPNVHSLK